MEYKNVVVSTDTLEEFARQERNAKARLTRKGWTFEEDRVPVAQADQTGRYRNLLRCTREVAVTASTDSAQ